MIRIKRQEDGTIRLRVDMEDDQGALLALAEAYIAQKQGNALAGVLAKKIVNFYTEENEK